MAFALKFRPRKISELAGQAVVQCVVSGMLKKYEKTGEIPVAVILRGQFGCGKTTTARILARYLNCVDGPLTACLECPSCKSLEADERHPDVIEADAATYKRESDIKELMKKMEYAINYKMKVIILDECHMLDKGAWASLLKPLESRRDILYILCTTEMDKIPQTILSRSCDLHFNTVDDQSLIQNMHRVIAEENLKIQEDALWMIAHKSHGHVRDSLELLEKASFFTQGAEIDVNCVSSVLGLIPQEEIHPLLYYFLEPNQQATVLGYIQQLSNWSPKVVIESMIDLLEVETYNRFNNGTPKYNCNLEILSDAIILLQQTLKDFKLTTNSLTWLLWHYYRLHNEKTIVLAS